jgi:hypothetical protein
VNVAALIGVALAAAAAASAQPASIAAQEEARARLLLHSTQSPEKAWGAYFAGRLHSTDLDSTLVDELRAAAPLAGSAHFGSDEYGLLAALFDALIESDIQVPADLLQPFEGAWTAPVLILLARGGDGDREQALLRFTQSRSDLVWLAANNLLSGMKSQLWYGGLLGELSITHRFAVVDPGVGWGFGGSRGGTCSDGMTVFPKGFPPIGFYSLEGTARSGVALLAPGPQNVYYQRTVIPTDKQVGFGSCFSVDRQQARIGYLAELSIMEPKQVQQIYRAETQITYAGLPDFERRVQTALDAQSQGIRQLLAAIAEHGLATPRGLALRIVPEVIDHRRNPAEALPAVAARDILLN